MAKSRPKSVSPSRKPVSGKVTTVFEPTAQPEASNQAGRDYSESNYLWFLANEEALAAPPEADDAPASEPQAELEPSAEAYQEAPVAQGSEADMRRTNRRTAQCGERILETLQECRQARLQAAAVATAQRTSNPQEVVITPEQVRLYREEFLILQTADGTVLDCIGKMAGGSGPQQRREEARHLLRLFESLIVNQNGGLELDEAATGALADMLQYAQELLG